MDLQQLNPMQRKAAETLNGPLLIIAGAGSGKTRTMTYRIAHLLSRGVPAHAIMALTFTNKAAREMKNRVSALTGDAAEDAWIGTFHSICVRILRRDIEKLGYKRSFVIYDEDDQSKVLRDIYRDLDIDDKRFPPREARAVISDAKNRLLTADEWFAESGKDWRNQKLHDIFVAYERKLRASDALDFDDLISHTLQLLVDHPPVLQYYRNRFQYVHVDEYQDTNFAQYSLVRLLTEESRNLCVVGDDDQSIYGWRGADIRNILDFQKDFPDAQVVKLEQNYRSTSSILDAANQVIANNEGRMEKALWTELGEGEKIKLCSAGDEREEAAWICERIRRLQQRKVPYSEIAILYRTHAQSRVLEEMFMRAAIPYRVYGGTRFYDRREIRDVVAYLRLIINPMDEVALKRIINVPKRSIGDATVTALENHARDRDIPLFSALSDLPDTLSSRPKKCVGEFVAIINKLTAMQEAMPLTQFVELLLEETGLVAVDEESNDEEALARRENVMEFVGAVKEFEEQHEDATLASFLENVALVTDLDRQEDAPQFITLMTLHSAKGLEFDAVFMAGLEDGLFPSSRSRDDEDRLQEERRLCYVGMTRARKFLCMSWAKRRSLFNQITYNDRSRFLGEIPARLLSDDWARTMNKHFGEREDTDFITRHTPAKPPKSSFGIPGMGQKVDHIPGVQKGFVKPAPKRPADAPSFAAGDRVLHRKFGEGTVLKVEGGQADGRVTVVFTAYGEKKFALSLAPIVKLE